MNNELVKIDFSADQIALIKSQIAPKATDDELKLFIYQAKRTGLDPMARQIYAIHRKQGGQEKMTIQVSIDGFRVIAERSGDYAGQDEPVFGTDEKGNLFCKVAVYRFRGDIRYQAAVGVAYWNEYCPMFNGQPSGMWAKMPRTMLSKVAEALALRKAYPQDLSGLYSTEEMEQVDEKAPVYPKETERKNSLKKPPAQISDEQQEVIDLWADKIAGCNSLAELKKVFDEGKAIINNDPTLFALKESKKTALQSLQPA